MPNHDPEYLLRICIITNMYPPKEKCRDLTLFFLDLSEVRNSMRLSKLLLVLDI